jgi:hypothetical protein
MMLTTRFWGGAAVLLCAVLLQSCQLNSLRAAEEEALDGEKLERRCVRKDVLTVLLNAANSEPAEAIQFLKALLVAAQDKHCRQQALEALDNVAKASPDILSACLSSLQAAAEEGDKDVCLLALKTLGGLEWRHYFGEVEPAPDLPRDIDTILDAPCPFWPEKIVRDTHLLVLIPATVDEAPFSLNLLGELIQRAKNGEHETKYGRYYSDQVRAQFGNSSPGRSYWLLMTRDVLECSRGRGYSAQRALVARYTGGDGLPYEIPGALEAATAILMHHARTRAWLFGGPPWTYTRCQELVDGKYPIVVGGFEPSGLDVDDGSSYGHHSHGVVCCRKF